MRLTRPLLLAGSFIALLTIALLMRFPSAGAGALEPSISLLPPAGDVHVGETFDVVAYAEHLDGIGAYELELRFDDDAVAFVGFDDGDVLGSTGRTVYCIAGPSSSEGVQFGCASSGAAPGASGEGIIAVFTFEALDIGNTNIRLRDAALANVNGDPIEVETENATVFITDAATGAEGTVTHTQTVEAQPTSGTTSTVEPNQTVEVTETVAPHETETVAPTEEADETNTPVPTSTEATTTETPIDTETPEADTPTVAAETETPAPEVTVVASETPDEGETTTPESTETVASETETPAPEVTPTPGEEKPTETATVETPRPSETPEGTGTPGFVPPTATPGQQTATTTSVATATNTSVIKTHTPAASTSTSTSGTQPASTSSPAATTTVAPVGTTNAVLGTTNDGPTGIVLPVTGSGGDDGGADSFGYAGILLAVGMAATMAIAAAVKRRAD